MSSLYNYLIGIGHDQKRIKEELVALLRVSLIISESQEPDQIDLEDLISINTPGIMHLELVNNVDYLSSCAEDMWYDNAELANELAWNMSGEGQFAHLSLQTVLANSSLFVIYLKSYFEKYFSIYSEYLNEGSFFLPLDFNAINESIEKFKQSIKYNKYIQFEAGSIFKAKVVNIKEYGIIVELLNTEQTGLIHVSKIKDADFENVYHLDDILDVRILEYKEAHKKYNLEIVI